MVRPRSLLLLATFAFGGARERPLVARPPAAARAAKTTLPVVSITSVPQAEPDPPLKYQLTPAYGKLQPGNAATSYYRAIVLLPRDEKLQFGEDTGEMAGACRSTSSPRRKPASGSLRTESVLDEVRTATFREDCEWSHRMRELKGIEPIAFLLPEMQEARSIARVLRVKSRLEIAEGNFDDGAADASPGGTDWERMWRSHPYSSTIWSALPLPRR